MNEIIERGEIVMLDKTRIVSEFKKGTGHIYLPADLINKRVVGVVVKKVDA